MVERFIRSQIDIVDLQLVLRNGTHIIGYKVCALLRHIDGGNNRIAANLVAGVLLICRVEITQVFFLIHPDDHFIVRTNVRISRLIADFGRG